MILCWPPLPTMLTKSSTISVFTRDSYICIFRQSIQCTRAAEVNANLLTPCTCLRSSPQPPFRLAGRRSGANIRTHKSCVGSALYLNRDPGGRGTCTRSQPHGVRVSRRAHYLTIMQNLRYLGAYARVTGGANSQSPRLS